MRYSTLMFDLDGTLSDPAGGFVSSVNAALAEHGLPTRPAAELTPFIGPPIHQSLRTLVGDEPALIESLRVGYRRHYNERGGYLQNALYDGVRDTLQALRAAGCRLAVCTSKPQPGAGLVLDHHGLTPLFDFVSAGRDNPKTEQVAELLAAGQIDTGALMIGDRRYDLRAGHENGMAAGACRWGHGSAAEIDAESPEWVFERPSDWLRLLD